MKTANKQTNKSININHNKITHQPKKNETLKFDRFASTLEIRKDKKKQQGQLEEQKDVNKLHTMIQQVVSTLDMQNKATRKKKTVETVV